jgi:ABC-type glutathione transport system ATPase component
MPSPRRRSPKKGASGGSTPKDVSVDVVSTPLGSTAASDIQEEMKDQELQIKDLSSSPSDKAVVFGAEHRAPSPSPFDAEQGPRVLTPLRAQSTVIQTSGVEIAFHQLGLTATYVSKRMKRKTRRILKGISGITPKGSCTAVMGPSGCGKTSLLHTLAGKNAKSKVRGTCVIASYSLA